MNTKTTTKDDLLRHRDYLFAFAQGLYELYDAERDGDYWTAIALPDGGYADINAYCSDDGYLEHAVRTIYITAYPVTAFGETVTDADNTLALIELRVGNGRNK